jgi:hypothetical protein
MWHHAERKKRRTATTEKKVATTAMRGQTHTNDSFQHTFSQITFVLLLKTTKNQLE